MNARPYDILVVGELNVDIIVRGDVRPKFGQVEKLVDDLSVYAGSSGGIFAASAARMGLRVLYVSRVGDDLFGHFAVDEMRKAGVDTSFIKIDPTVKTGASVALSTGVDRAMLTYLGSITAVTAEDVKPEYYEQARHLHVVSPFLLKGLRPMMPKMMRAAKQAGMTVSLDTNWDPTEQWELEGFFDHLDIFLPNEQEVQAITGQRSLEGAVSEMANRVPLLVVKRGKKGAMATHKGRRVEVPAFPVKTVDTTGAGDSFDGGFVAAWLKGQPLKCCLTLGAACGAMTTTALGGFNGQPSWEEALDLIHGPCNR
ncbi:MAG: sugar kinase [Chloroflexota bacterium]|nr:sugar kinase [Chloroflexota bacterium]